MIEKELAYWEDVAARYKKALERICAEGTDYLYEAQRIAKDVLRNTIPVDEAADRAADTQWELARQDWVENKDPS